MLLAAARPVHWLIWFVSVVLFNYQSDEENLTYYLSSFPVLSCICESLIQLIFGNFFVKAQVRIRKAVNQPRRTPGLLSHTLFGSHLVFGDVVCVMKINERSIKIHPK